MSARGRIRCDLGTFNNCFSINSDGSLGSVLSGSAGGFALIPGLLYAFKSVGLVPSPASCSLLLAGLGMLAFRSRRPS